MLSPNVNTVLDNLARAYSTVTKVDSFAYASRNTFIGQLSPDPEWLRSMRSGLALINGAGAQWQQKKPEIWTPLLQCFLNYYSLFAGFTEASRSAGNDKETWIEILQELATTLGQYAIASRTAERAFTLQVNDLNNIEQVFTTNLGKAWSALAQEEAKMIALAEQITHLQDQVNALQSELSWGAISNGKSFLQTTVSIHYDVAIAANLSMPYLTIAGLIFTVGKAGYDIISTDYKITETIGKIVELRNELSTEAQAAAMAKAIIQLIHQFDTSLAAIGRQLPALSSMWETERTKVNDAISALKAGAQPKNMTSLVAMPAAAATWQTLADFVAKLLVTPPMGQPVVLSTSLTPQQ